MINYSKLNNKELLELQIKYRKKEIKESEIPENQLLDLKQLYLEQIDFLERSIENDRQKLLKLKNKLKKWDRIVK